MAEELNGLVPGESTQLLEPNLARGTSAQYSGIMNGAAEGRVLANDPLAYTYNTATYTGDGKVQANTHHLISRNVANNTDIANFLKNLARESQCKYVFDINNPRNLMALPTTEGSRNGMATAMHSPGYPNEHRAADAAVRNVVISMSQDWAAEKFNLGKPGFPPDTVAARTELALKYASKMESLQVVLRDAHVGESIEKVVIYESAKDRAYLYERYPELVGKSDPEFRERLAGHLTDYLNDRVTTSVLKKPKILIFDEAVSNLDQQTAEHFARTINTLKGKVTMIFITHQIPRGLQVDDVIAMGEHGVRMGVVAEQPANKEMDVAGRGEK